MHINIRCLFVTFHGKVNVWVVMSELLQSWEWRWIEFVINSHFLSSLHSFFQVRMQTITFIRGQGFIKKKKKKIEVRSCFGIVSRNKLADIQAEHGSKFTCVSIVCQQTRISDSFVKWCFSYSLFLGNLVFWLFCFSDQWSPLPLLSVLWPLT